MDLDKLKETLAAARANTVHGSKARKDIAAIAPDLAAEVLRLTAERDAAVAANAALMVRVEEARRLLSAMDQGDGIVPFLEWATAARAWLAGKAGA